MARKISSKKHKKKLNFIKTRIFDEIIGLISIFFGIYSLYSLFSKNSGFIGNYIHQGLYFILGKTSYIFAVGLIILGIIFIIKGINTSKVTIFSLILFIFNLSIAITLWDGVTTNQLNSADILLLVNTQLGGGLTGIFFASLFVKLLSVNGTIIIIVVSTIISLLLMTQKTLYDLYMSIKHDIEIKKKTNNVKRESIKKDKLKSDHVKQESIKEIEEKIKILDYTDIRRSKPPEQKEEAVKKTPSKVNKQIEKKITELETKTQTGPLMESKKEFDYIFPPIDLLIEGIAISSNNKKEILNNAGILEKTLADFGVKAKVIEVSMGPTVTRYELQPEAGVKVSKIVNLSNDLALNLATSNVRIEAPIPGKAAVGIEVPNKHSSIVNIREIIDSTNFKKHHSKLAFAIGKRLSGSIVMGDLATMPHMLIAGATGSGKSVCINSIITSILYKASPEEVKLILIDPKMVELNHYNGIPHLLIPVVTDPKHAAGALNWAIREMTERYKLFKDNGVRDITRYHEVMKDKNGNSMPKIVIIIDELADLMMVAAREVENAICRLAQLARAAGIHLVLATQRPSVDVITGLIKANVPSRISFAVSSMVDSRTILDMGGAEKLLGRGDMLYYPVGESKPIRVQGTFITDREVEKVVKFVKNQGKVAYDEQVIHEIKEVNNHFNEGDSAFQDDMLPKAIALTLESDQISTSMIQRKLRVGYARAGRIIDEMEEKGIISGPEGSKPRKVLMTKTDYYSNIELTKEE
ncbi:MAG: DNA translocase FtsK [Eubacteriales bacterium]